MDINTSRIIEKLSNSDHRSTFIDEHRIKAAVLIPLFKQEGIWRVLFTRRSQNVQDHKGQVSFPGGAFEWLDENLEATALRETEEEIGIPREKITVLGRMEPFASISNFLITPVVGVLEYPFDVRIAVEEVDKVFSIELAWLTDKDNREVRDYTRSNGSVEKVLFFREYEGELVWGITARILSQFLELTAS
jgi:8-oxo-dGTP pyrophosphatase MutT (NUDIX family)